MGSINLDAFRNQSISGYVMLNGTTPGKLEDNSGIMSTAGGKIKSLATRFFNTTARQQISLDVLTALKNALAEKNYRLCDVEVTMKAVFGEAAMKAVNLGALKGLDGGSLARVTAEQIRTVLKKLDSKAAKHEAQLRPPEMKSQKQTGAVDDLQDKTKDLASGKAGDVKSRSTERQHPLRWAPFLKAEQEINQFLADLPKMEDAQKTKQAFQEVKARLSDKIKLQENLIRNDGFFKKHPEVGKEIMASFQLLQHELLSAGAKLKMDDTLDEKVKEMRQKMKADLAKPLDVIEEDPEGEMKSSVKSLHDSVMLSFEVSQKIGQGNH